MVRMTGFSYFTGWLFSKTLSRHAGGPCLIGLRVP